jgi:hypothetical protein
MRKEMIFFALILMVFSFIPGVRADESKVVDSCTPDLTTIIEKKLGAYQIRILRDQDHACQRMEILKEHQILFQEEGFDNHYSYFRLRPKNHDAQLVVKRFTGGAHCCTSLLIFNLGSKFKKIAEVDGGNFEPEIVDLDHDGIPEIRVPDDFLAYVFSDFGHSAIADVILKYESGRYSIAPEFMRKPPMGPKALKNKAAWWQKLLRQKKTPNWPPEKLIQDFTDLVYTGHKKVALTTLDQAWPVDVEGKSDFLRSFHVSLAHSQYYPDFEKIVSPR